MSETLFRSAEKSLLSFFVLEKININLLAQRNIFFILLSRKLDFSRVAYFLTLSRRKLIDFHLHFRIKSY